MGPRTSGAPHHKSLLFLLAFNWTTNIVRFNFSTKSDILREIITIVIELFVHIKAISQKTKYNANEEDKKAQSALTSALKQNKTRDAHTTSGRRRRRHLANDYETPSNYSSSNEARRRRRRAAPQAPSSERRRREQNSVRRTGTYS